ncbi:alanine--glyoxylate aminotransferase family protein [Spirulina sp. 06S082]|uniref:pyridoxal-phosphate-dependent aminotransferase family protein n=1 Tax=Spirulina sp. 06S082 TaxID=3110248 RepID=UPI002B1F8001|nr:alanine--glyoxylate aminotransferase family protein [Spirulina sp. 06S082]MEA5468729.1 alanine--glyoxylate aminotransferase family protein [Spirulina sp. 06S082]
MEDKQLLMIPGPTPIPARVLQAIAKHPIGHRSKAYSKIQEEVTANLKWLHQTEQDVQALTVSGTGAMEAGVINFLSAGDRVLVGCNGKFGERWAEMAATFALRIECISAEWGKPLDPAAFEAKLEADKEKQIKAVIITHSETSTAVLNDLEGINKAVKAHGEALMIVDAVTSLGAMNIPIDEWGLDVVASGSQKGYMVPPGLGFVAVSAKAWKAYETATLPKYYLDLGLHRKATAKNSTAFTPPINLVFGLQESLRMMREEGLENIFARHDRLKRATRAGVKALGLGLLCEDEVASPAVTAVMPTNVEAEKIRSLMQEKFAISLAGGQDHLKGKIFRIGHLGFVCDRDILTVIAALEAVLQELGQTNFTPGAGVAAANQVFVG